MSAFCPECEATLNLENVVQGEIVVCPECGVDLEVTAVKSAENHALFGRNFAGGEEGTDLRGDKFDRGGDGRGE